MSEHADNTLAVEAHADSAASGAALPRIALLHADDALLAHVEQTLAAMRVPIVYRAAIEQAEPAALAAATPEIALINLDDRCGDKLDALTAMLDGAGVPIVFNDADISHGLEGWARARWARHLVAKLCGKQDVDPPRPAQDAAQPSANIVTEASAQNVAAPALVASAAEQEEEPASQTVSASRPLSPNEIESLLADFPSEANLAGEDTQALSAHVDALLANAADSASHEPAPWEVIGFADEQAESAAEIVETPTAAPAKSVTAASADQWQLLDDFTPTATIRESQSAAPAANFGSGLALELEPLAPVIVSMQARDNAFAEMRLDESKPSKRESGK